mgnify:CR=1 FL=1
MKNTSSEPEIVDTALATTPPAPLETFDTAGALRQVIDAGITEGNVAALEKLADMHMKMQAVADKKSFARSFAALQRDCKAVVASEMVPDKQGNPKFFFAPFKKIWEQVEPIAQRHGFSITFDQKIDDKGRCTATCTLIHEDGHERSNSFTVSGGGTGAPGMSSAQNDEASSSIAKRRALCDALNVVVVLSGDVREHGAPIGEEVGAALKARVIACGGDPDKFLAMADAGSFAEIMSAKLPELIESLSIRERSKPSQPKHKPCPVPFTEATDWRNAMIEEMGDRGFGDAKACAKHFDSVLKSKGFESYLSMPADRREAAWIALVSDKFPKP